MKTSDLTGLLLDYWVAKSLGWETGRLGTQSKTDPVDRGWYGDGTGDYGISIDQFKPSQRWQTCGPLIEKYRIAIGCSGNDDHWTAYIPRKEKYVLARKGETPLIAVCRCIVASQYGDEVDA